MCIGVNTNIMNRHFCPRPSQRRNKTGAKDYTPKIIKYKQSPPYSLIYWRKIKKSELFDIFYISFSVENDPQVVYDSLMKEFGDNVGFICNWAYLYEVLLKTDLTWGEIIDRVDKTFKEKTP